MSTPDHAPIQVRVTYRYAASAERVFDAWLSPALIGRFLFGPEQRDEEIVSLRLEPRVGGHFSFVVRRDGELLDHRGTYLELDRPRRLVFGWGVNEDPGDASRVTLVIVPAGAGCELTLTHEIPPRFADYAERTRAGWTKITAALDVALRAEPSPAAPSPTIERR